MWQQKTGVNDPRWAEADSTMPEPRVLLGGCLPELFPTVKCSRELEAGSSKAGKEGRKLN